MKTATLSSQQIKIFQKKYVSSHNKYINKSKSFLDIMKPVLGVGTGLIGDANKKEKQMRYVQKNFS